MYINEFLDYIMKIRRYSLRTVQSYGNDLTAVSQFLFGIGTDMDHATTKQLSSYIIDCMERGLQPKSINQHLAAIRSYYDYCCRFENFQHNPAAGLRDVRTPKLLPKFISEEKMNFLIDHLLPSDTFKQMRTRIVILLFYHTGIRCNELANLSFDRINFFKDFIKVLGKGDKERYIPFGQELHNELLKYFAMCPNKNASPKSCIIQTMWGEPCTSFQIRRICKMALRRIVPANLAHPHVLRHTFATVMMNHGARIENVRILMGHASCDTTAIYQHVSISYLRQSYNNTFER